MGEIKEKYWHETFIVAIVIKTFTGLLETASGLLLLFINPPALDSVFARLARGELTEVPQDYFISYSHQYIQHLTAGTKDFAGLYILAHGLINLLLVLGLIKEKTAAYLVGIGVLLSFMLYQIYRASYTHSLALVLLTIFDCFFVVLIWHEYNYLTRKLKKV
jgi:uncharacterized membrane protein